MSVLSTNGLPFWTAVGIRLSHAKYQLRRELGKRRAWKRLYLVFHPVSVEEEGVALKLVEVIEPYIASDLLAVRYWYASNRSGATARRKRREWRDQERYGGMRRWDDDEVKP